jgi:hypothetical protein
MNFKLLFTLFGFMSLVSHSFEHTTLNRDGAQAAKIQADTTHQQLPNKDAATVEQMEGFYVFCDAKPTRPYKYLGTAKFVLGLQTQYAPVRNRLLKVARKSYPDADGIILRFNNMSVDKADVIKFD